MENNMCEEYQYCIVDGLPEYNFKLEIKQGTFEMFATINSYGFMDYNFFLDQQLLDGGVYGGYWCNSDNYGHFNESAEVSLYEQEWGYLCSSVLKDYDFENKIWRVSQWTK